MYMSRVKSAANATQMTSRRMQTSWSHWSLCTSRYEPCFFFFFFFFFFSAQNSTTKLSSPFILGELDESR